MAKQTIGIGSSANDGTGYAIRTAFDKSNDNFNELYNVTGNLTLSALGSGTSFSLDFSAATTFTATASGAATFNFSNALQGQVIDLVLSGNYAITFAETGSTFNKVGSTDYDGSTNNLIQIVCTDSTSGSKIYHYSVGAYTSDTTP